MIFSMPAQFDSFLQMVNITDTFTIRSTICSIIDQIKQSKGFKLEALWSQYSGVMISGTLSVRYLMVSLVAT